MTFGLNLSFAVKRWITPELWAPVVRAMGIDTVQLSLDLVDPMWPDVVLDDHAARVGDCGITVHSAFIGLAHYTFSQLLHPDSAVRDYAEAWTARAYRFAARAGIPGVGGPLGAIASNIDGRENDAIPADAYRELLTRLHRLGAAAADAGLDILYIEPTPLKREMPWSIDQAQRLMADLDPSPTPWRWCLDWGHATMAPLYGDSGSRMETWLAALGEHTGILHLQQTDGVLDRHWDFTQPGIVEPHAAAAMLRAHGLQDRPVFLEIFYPFELSDAEVLDRVRASCELLRPAFP